MEPINKETDTVGLKISTKAVGFNRRHDLTDDYKHPEGKMYWVIFQRPWGVFTAYFVEYE